MYCFFAIAALGPLCANADTTPTDKAQVSMEDTAITAKIKALYAQSPLVKSTTISVTTHHDTVILKGTVPTDLQYEAAISMAQSINGVTQVNVDHLKVTASKAPLTDTYITAKVKGTILKEKLFGDKAVQYWPIKVETKDGVVYLTGVVDTEEQQANIVNLVNKIQGITSVKSSITVK